MFGAIAGGIASALAGGAMSKLFGGGQKAASGGIQGDVLRSEEGRVGEEGRFWGGAGDLKKKKKSVVVWMGRVRSGWGGVETGVGSGMGGVEGEVWSVGGRAAACGAMWEGGMWGAVVG